jgi:glucose/arabinose dehydrogenase
LGLDQHYGYPYCWREYQLGNMGLGQGTAWAWPTTMDNVTDQDCRERYDEPVATLPAHSAPLGMTFYRYQNETTCPGIIPFPAELDGFAFIAYHGSWNRDIPTGYKVVFVDLRQQANGNATPPTDLLSSAGCYAKWDDGTRPVDLTFDRCGRLWVTSDGSSRGRGSNLIIIESTSTVLLPQPPTEIPCAWRLPAWAIGLTVGFVGGGLILMLGAICFRKRRNNFTRLIPPNVN